MCPRPRHHNGCFTPDVLKVNAINRIKPYGKCALFIPHGDPICNVLYYRTVSFHFLDRIRMMIMNKK